MTPPHQKDHHAGARRRSPADPRTNTTPPGNGPIHEADTARSEEKLLLVLGR